MRFKILSLIFSACMFSTTCLLAQDNSSIGLTLPVLTLSNSGTAISSIQIISNLEDSVLIGILPSPYPNVRTNIVIPEGVQSWLQNYSNQQYSNSFQSGGKQLL